MRYCFVKKFMALIKYAVAIVFAVIFALFTEYTVFMHDTVWEYSAPAYSLLDKSVCEMASVNYKVDDKGTFTPTAIDPQLLFFNVDESFTHVVITFNKRNYTKTQLQLFYAKAGEEFSEKCSRRIIIPFGATDLILEVPEGEYASLRLDIDDKCTIKDITVTSAEPQPVRKMVSPMSRKRVAFMALAAASVLCFILFILKYTARILHFNGTLLKRVTEWIKGTVKKHPYVSLLTLILLTAIIVFFDYLFRKQVFIFSDIGGDTQNVYYPFFQALRRKLYSGDLSLWDHTHGLGTNMITRQADMGSIFTYLICIFSPSKLKYAIVVVHVLKIFIAGTVAYFYLDNFRLSPYVKVIGAYAFAFNGFIMLWGQHYFFVSACIYAALMLFAVERTFKNRYGYLWLAFSTFLTCLTSYYFAYMILLVTAIYALFRLIYVYTLKDVRLVLTKIGVMMCAVLLGFMMSAILLLPSVYTVTSTSARLSEGMSLAETVYHYIFGYYYDSATVEGIIARFFSNNLFGASNYIGPENYYEMPQWFITSFVPFFGFLLVTDSLFDKKASVKAKVLKCLGTATVILLAFTPLPSVILNGFVKPFFRYTYLVMPVFALLIAVMLDKIFHKALSAPKVQIICGAVFTLGALLFTLINIPESKPKCLLLGIAYLALGAMLCAVAYLLSTNVNGAKRTVLCALIMLVIITNVSLDSYVTNNSRDSISDTNKKIYMATGNTDVTAALEHVKSFDNTFYRTEKTYHDIAFLNDSMLQDYYGVSVYNSVVNKDIIDFVTYLCPELHVTEANGYYDYRKIYSDASMSAVLGVKYVISEIPIEVEGYVLEGTFNSVYLYRNKLATGIGAFYGSTISYDEILALTVEERKEKLTSSIVLNGEGFDSSGTVTFDRPEKSHIVTGRVSCDGEGYVFVPIPCEDGWTAYVDGVETPIEKADYAFMAIRVDGGEHEITLRYSTPYLKAGAVVSLVGIIIFGGLWLLIYLKEKRGNVK